MKAIAIILLFCIVGAAFAEEISSEVERSAGAICARDDFASKKLEIRDKTDDAVRAAIDAGYAAFVKAAGAKAGRLSSKHVAHVESWRIADTQCDDSECNAFFITVDASVKKAAPARYLLEVTQNPKGYELSRFERVSPIDCQVSAWSLGTECSAKCGGGTSTKSRCVTVRPQYGGKACPALRAEVPCNTQPCAIDCQVSRWTDWSQCSAKCAGGLKTRTRKITVQPAFGGKACPALSEAEVCNQQMCTREYSPQTCVSTAKLQSLAVSANLTSPSVISEAKNAFKLLLKHNRDQPYAPASGNIATSILDVTTWKVPGSKPHVYVTLSLSLDGTTSSRVFIEVQKGGDDEEDILIRHEMVSKVDCAVSAWSEKFSECSKKCGGGVRSRWRCVTQIPKFGGAVCPSLYEVQICNPQKC